MADNPLAPNAPFTLELEEGTDESVDNSTISEMEFTHCPFWVQVHGLPLDKMTRRNGQIIGESIGHLIGVAAPNDGLLLSRSFLRIRVDMNVTLPLTRGI
ncbi:hypothetical protein ACSBR2_036407 [Camellia fascicularis]